MTALDLVCYSVTVGVFITLLTHAVTALVRARRVIEEARTR